VAIDLVGRNLVIALQTELPRHLQQRVRAVDAGLDEGVGVHDGAVDVGLGGEVDDGVDVVGAHGGGDVVAVTDVAAHELITRVVLDGQKVVEVAGIGQFVIDHNAVRLRLGQQVVNKVGTNEARSARDK
jgi:hypothetical protein